MVLQTQVRHKLLQMTEKPPIKQFPMWSMYYIASFWKGWEGMWVEGRLGVEVNEWMHRWLDGWNPQRPSQLLSWT